MVLVFTKLVSLFCQICVNKIYFKSVAPNVIETDNSNNYIDPHLFHLLPSQIPKYFIIYK
jgi:hypothetical protein